MVLSSFLTSNVSVKNTKICHLRYKAIDDTIILFSFFLFDGNTIILKFSNSGDTMQ